MTSDDLERPKRYSCRNKQNFRSLNTVVRRQHMLCRAHKIPDNRASLFLVPRVSTRWKCSIGEKPTMTPRHQTAQILYGILHNLANTVTYYQKKRKEITAAGKENVSQSIMTVESRVPLLAWVHRNAFHSQCSAHIYRCEYLETLDVIITHA